MVSRDGATLAAQLVPAIKELTAKIASLQAAIDGGGNIIALRADVAIGDSQQTLSSTAELTQQESAVIIGGMITLWTARLTAAQAQLDQIT